MDVARIQALRFWEALDAFATNQEPAVAAALRKAIADAQLAFTDAELEQIVVTGRVDELLAAIDFDAVKFALRDAAIAGATQTPFGFTAVNGAIVGAWPTIIQVRFDTLAPYAVASLTDFESKAIQVLQQDIRAGIVSGFKHGLQTGQNPVQTAREIRGLLGLPDNLVQAVNRYRSELLSGNSTELRNALDRALRDQRFDRSLLQAMDGTLIDPVKVERMVARYEARALQFNAETIARTGTMDALNLGNRLAWQQAIDSGKVNIHDLRRFWIVARDERTCERCLTIPQLNPEGRGMDEPFVTPYDGLVMIPTLHFRCRCVIYTKFIG